MKNYRTLVQVAAGLVLCLATTVVLVNRSSASIGNINKGDLTGSWQVSLYGQGGCGVGTSQVNFILNGSGVGTATTKSHSVGCGDITATGDTFTITSLATNGSGTATLTCGASCGFVFSIQVAPDRSSFTLVDLTDGGNFLEGTAVHQ
jgi:hypothetical protein